ncbi:hypothetical protein [uncultured Porphyromonas sp.]|uniref:hypothetical protein n=1 Tax=uncultured Porphyromonas sp. TaxID=159274 RepID=UPI002598F3F5|nr:hypothetical protein [uncultured Porphyromonas sp.]
MKIYRPDGKLWREVVALDSSFCEETLERFNRISLDFVLAEEVLVPELCYVTWRGERYSLFSTPKAVKVSTREYRYTLNLEGRHLELDRVLVKDKLGRTKFVFTGRTDQYAELISDCLPSWKVGACATGDTTRVIAFNNTSLLEACRMVASKFETEVQLTDGAISFGRVERYKSDPLLLAYRNGLKKDITVEPDPKETAIGRLYVVGGDRNIDPAKYGSHQLHLSKGGKVSVGGHSFVADAEGRYISLEGDTRLNTSERAFDASSIYPKRVGTVSKVEQVGDEWDVLDDANTIDYGQHRVGGDTMRLEFQSGRLAGRTFDLATKDDKLVGYVHSEKRFKLVRKEIDGVLMPEPTTFYPAVGDKYAIFGCSLPDEYITSAEGEMLLRGAEYMAERLEPRLQYRAELDGLWAKKNWATVAHKLVVGTIVRLEGASSEVRISSVRTSLNSPYTPRITFSNAPYMVGSLATQIATLENAEVRQREELRAGLVKLQDRTYKDTEAVREMVEKLKIDGFSKALKPETLQTMYAVIGSSALQFEFVGGGFSWTEGKGGAITIPRQTIRQRVAGTTLEPEPKTVETTIPALTYTLKPDEQQAHIYVELKPTPRYVVSTKPLQITPDRLLVGLLNGTEGSRDFTPLYGFTEISPSHIATRYIRSRSGNMLIDLETGNIYSDKIEFKRPDGSTKDIDQVISEGVQVGGRNLAVMSRMVPGYLCGDYNGGSPGDIDYKVKQYYPFNYDPTYYPIEEGAKLVWVIKRTVNPERNAVAIIHWHNENKELISWDYGNWRHPAGTPRVLTAPKGTRYYRFGIPEYPKRIQVKLERGTVATDWSPAPEDVQASIENEAKAREEGDKAQADSTQTLQQALDALRESGANDNATLTDLINKANQRLDNLQEQADGEVSNWFYPGAPAPDKAPENEWTTNGLKARHIGDTYTSTDESGQFMGKSWRYTTEFKWQEIHDTLVSQALAQASKAQTTADGKSTTFLVKPTKYEEGDTWVMESSQVLNGISYEAGTMLFAKQGSSAFVESHWVDKVRYIGATQLKESEEASKRAWEAYANAQAEAERVKAEAHADGIVTAEEQARIEATNKALETAKAYAEAQDKLLEERQKAYADGVLTEAERRAVDVAEKKAKLAETNAKAYSDGVLTEAERKAIAEAQKAYDDAVKRAEELDGQLQVGGRNLLLKSNEGISNSDYSVGRYYIADPSMMIAGEAYTIQIWGEAEGADFSEALWVYNSGGNTEVSNIQNRVKGVWKQTFKWRNDPNKSNSSLVIFRGTNHPNYKKGSKTSITRIKLEKGSIATDWTPAPEDIQADIDKEAQARATAVQEINAGLSNANTLIATLNKAQAQLEQGLIDKTDTKDIQYLLDSLKNGKTQVAGGLVLTNDIILSDPNSKDVTAMISGTQTEGAKAMRLGIDYGGDKIAPLYEFIGASKTYEIRDLPTREEQIKRINELGYTIYRIQKAHEDAPTYWLVYRTEEKKDIGEATAFNNNGTGHIGELFFNGNYIGFGDALNSYMQVGGTARAESDMVNASTEMVTELMGATDASKSGRFSIRRLHSFTGFRDITLDLDLTLEAKARAARSKYGNDTGNLRPTDPKNPSGRYDDNYVFYESRRVTMRATIEVLHTRVDGVVVKTLKSEQVSVQAIAPGGSGEDLTRSPELLFGESELNKKVQFVIQSKDLRKGDGLEVFLVTERVGDNDYGCEGRASAKLVVTYPKDTSKPEVRITQDKTSFFYGRSRYMLLNYDNLIAKIVGDVLMKGNLNVKGTVTADAVDTPGIPLCGAMVDKSGTVFKSFGRYKNRSGMSQPQASYNYSTKSFTVYHSIPHSRYIPLVNPFNDPASPVVSDVSAYSFKVRFTLQQYRNDGWAVGFSYIAFKAE